MTGLAASLALYGVTASAGSSPPPPSRPIRVDQTDGYADGKVVVFTYGENYQCVHEPFDDRDGDGVVAAQDPDEFQKPIRGHVCVAE